MSNIHREQDVPYYHVPVLVHEVLTYLAPRPGGLYVDATFGGGGHSRAILEAEPQCRVIAFDWDKETIDRHADLFIKDFPQRISFVWGNFAHIARLLRKEGIAQIDGVLADFGTSQFHLRLIRRLICVCHQRIRL